MSNNKEYITFLGEHLGSIEFSPGTFSKTIFQEFDSPSFQKLGTFHKHEKVSSVLFEAIKNEPDDVFLLPKVIDYITRVRAILSTYHLASFEFWFNQHTEISEEEKMSVRGKIVGKQIPRSEYQNFFPISSGTYLQGSHFSYAHISPDLDTTVASFACFLAAFGAKVGTSRQLWVLPGGPVKDSMEVELFFKKALGAEVFSVISSSSSKFLITALDLVSQKDIIRKESATLTYDIDPERGRQAVILVDERGCYLGDWRSVDVDPVRSITGRFRSFLAEYQNQFVVGIISLFSKDPLELKDWTDFLSQKFLEKFNGSLTSRELTDKQRHLQDKFIKEVLFIPNGLDGTIGEFFEAAKSFGFAEFQEKLESLKKSSIFDRKGELTENRAFIFRKLEEILSLERESFNRFFQYIDSLEVAMDVKKKVLGREPNFLSHLADLDEIASAIKDYSHLTVNYHENGNQYPLGVIYADDVNHKTIATTSWNDFSNPGETDLIEGVEVISYIDHHKSQIATTRPALGIVRSDAQSTNSIIARINFEINDRYSTGGLNASQIEASIAKVSKELHLPENVRILQRLLQKKNALKTRGTHCISVDREILEYMQYVFAILDDTDLLSKVTEYDVDGMASLLNRLKSIMVRDEVEIVNFDDLSRSDPEFPKKAARKLLQTPDLYSLYGVIYNAREQVINETIKDTASGGETHFFQDTKILGSGGYAAIAQFKHFPNNNQLLQENIIGIRKAWIERSKKLHKERPEVSLHICMISTVSSAEEMFSGKAERLNYFDELWFWVPPGDKRADHFLHNFLMGFFRSPRVLAQEPSILYCGSKASYETIFKESVHHKKFQIHYSREEPSMAVLKVLPGSIKSRKTDIAAYL